MNARSRLAAIVVTAGVATAGIVLAQGARQGGPAPQGQAAQGQAPAAGRGGRGQRGAAPAQGRQGGGRRGGFEQFTRELAPQDVILRGKALYETNCSSCHAADLRGGPKGTNLLRSGTALRDQKGELVTAAIARHSPRLTLIEADSVAIAEYIHSVHATMGGQGSPPGRIPQGIVLNVLVGDAKAGEAEFKARCASCHSVTGDLKGIGGRFDDARALQNAWIPGTGGGFGGGRGGGDAVTVTMADGSRLEGSLIRYDDFHVILRLKDGTRRTIARADGVPKVEVTDPQQAHKDMVMKLLFEDPDNSKMHNITAYLSTIK